ncbi:hypothetical protein L6R52_09400 [Myxococcota bacterium]|nr:hypothetical protein [Myxococcota bacterium]
MVAPGQPQGPYANLFYPLPPRLTMLLCTMFTQGGAEDLHILDHLPDDDAYALQEKSEALGQIDGEKRAALVVREMRNQLHFSGSARLESIDPTWLLAAVKGEQPLTIGIVLAQLPASARSKILSQLPQVVRDRIPAKEDLKGTRLEIMRIVRQKFEQKFVAMPAAPNEPTNFYFKDIALLESRELVQLVRALGIEELGAAFLTVGRRKLAELCNSLGPQAAEELITAVKETEPRDAMDMEDATAFLSRMLLGLKVEEDRGVDPAEAKDRFQRELFQTAGLFRLAKTIRLERPIFVQQLAQRLPRTHGTLLRSFVHRVNNGPLDEQKLRRLQDLVLYRVEKLAARGKVSPRYLKFTFCYWGDSDQQHAET